MATASAVELAHGYHYNTINDGGMDAYGYQMPAASYNAYNDYYNGPNDAELVYAPNHVSRARRAPSPQSANTFRGLVNQIVRIDLEIKRELKSIFFPRGR